MQEIDRVKEDIIIRLMAADELMSIEEATDFWAGWKAELARNPEHFGDCTKEPQTCNRCLIEDYYNQADQILSLKIDGTTLKELLEKLDETGGSLAIVERNLLGWVGHRGYKKYKVIWQGGQAPKRGIDGRH